MSATRNAIQRLLSKGKISAHQAHRMQTLFSHILRNSSSASQADIEAERYFNGLDGRFRPFLSILFLLLSQMSFAQTSFPDSRWETPDSIKLDGMSSNITIFPKQDSIIMVDSYGNTTWLTNPAATITAVSPSTGNIYNCYVFGKYGDTNTIIEYFYNPRTRLWGFVITHEGSYIVEGMEVFQPFPPLRPLPLKPVMARK